MSAPARIYTTSHGTRCRNIETKEIIGDVGWRWTRGRALRLAASMNSQRTLLSGLPPSHRFVIHQFGWGRWRVLALQNRLEPV